MVRPLTDAYSPWASLSMSFSLCNRASSPLSLFWPAMGACLGAWAARGAAAGMVLASYAWSGTVELDDDRSPCSPLVCSRPARLHAYERVPLLHKIARTFYPNFSYLALLSAPAARL